MMRYNRQCISSSAVIRQRLRPTGHQFLCDDKGDVDWCRRLRRLCCLWRHPSHHSAAAAAAILRRWAPYVNIGCSPAAQHRSSNHIVLNSCGPAGGFSRQPAADSSIRQLLQRQQPYRLQGDFHSRSLR